jgi:hypothetical protein
MKKQQKCLLCDSDVISDDDGEFSYEFFGKIFCSLKCRDEYLEKKE